MSLPLEHPDLPLDLTSFESLMLTVDRPDYPAAFLVQSKMSGRLNRQAFEEAVLEALERNPLLCSVVESRWGKKRWIWSPELRPQVQWSDLDRPIDLPNGEFMDLRKEVGTRIWVRENESRAEITYQIHHACCDGLGFGQFVIDVAAAYGIRTTTTSTPPTLAPIDTSLLATRGDRLPRQVGMRGDAVEQSPLQAIRATLKRLESVPAMVKTGERQTQIKTDIPFPGIRSHTFDKASTRGMREYARRGNGSINDLLIRDMMLAIQSWNETHGATTADGKRSPIRILMPASLRTGIDEELPAANVVGFTFVTRDVSQFNDDELFTEVEQETKTILAGQHGWIFEQAVSTMHRWRLMWVISLLVGWRPVSTSVLAHVGNLINRISSRVERRDGKLLMGDVIMEELMCVPPIRPQTLVACTTYMQAGCLTINMRCDPLSFTASESAEIMRMFADQLQRSAEKKMLVATHQ